MPDVDRAAVTREVFRKLAEDVDFRRRLGASGVDGAAIIVAFREDRMGWVLDQLLAVGGSGNVVVPHLNGLIVVEFERTRRVKDDDSADLLTQECTLGVFIEHMQIEGRRAYRFADDGVPMTGEAEMVAIAG